jgi:hypothetical protein
VSYLNCKLFYILQVSTSSHLDSMSRHLGFILFATSGGDGRNGSQRRTLAMATATAGERERSRR